MIPGRTVILTCRDCDPHYFQDSRLGVKRRVHNVMDKPHRNVARCTVCSNEREFHKPHKV